MSNRFHSKYHKHNHHTRQTDPGNSFPDSALDPIASADHPFQGDFHLDGDLKSLSSVYVAETLSAKNVRFEDLTVYNNLSVLGTNSILDTYLFCLSTVEIIANGDFSPALNVSHRGNSYIAKFTDVDSNKSVVITSASQVGIGTTIPSSQLHLSETNNTLSAAVLIESITSSFLQLKTPDLGKSEITFRGPNRTYASIYGTPSLSSLYFNTGNTTSLTIASGGNIGIGTTAPNERLTIDRNIGFVGNQEAHYIKSPGNGSSTNFVVFGNSNFTNPSSIHPFYTLKTASNQNITASDLDFIFDNQNFRQIVYYTSTNADANVSRYFSISGTPASPIALPDNSTLASVRGFAYSGNNTFAMYGKGGNVSVDLTTVGAQTTANGGSNIIFYTTLSGTTDRSERMKIDHDGSVGIGTSIPHLSAGKVLHLYNNSTDITTYNYDPRGYWHSPSQCSLYVESLSSTAQVRIKSPEETAIQFLNSSIPETYLGTLGMRSTTGDMFFATGGSVLSGFSTRMTITSGGNVGIGTSSAINVNGYTSLTVNSPSSGGRIDFSKNNTQFGIIYSAGPNLFDVEAIGASTAIRFNTNLTERLRISSNGNVGIGNTNPTSKLHVTGDIRIPAGSYLYLSENSDTRILRDATNNGISIQTANTNRVFVADSGNVGIGILTPSARLYVSGTTNLSGNVQVGGTTTLDGNTQVTGTTTLNGSTVVNGTTIVNGKTDVFGNFTVHGDLSSTGNQYFANTFFTTTSAISVVNISPVADVPALYIAQSGPGDIASFYDLDTGVEVLHVGGSNNINPNVGIKNSTPNKDFTVKGEISASGTIWDFDGNSNLWNSVYRMVQSLSSTWSGLEPLVTKTVGISASNIFSLSQTSTDIEILPPAIAVVEIGSFTNGTKGITYTLTNKTFNPITIFGSSRVIIRRGNGWRSNTTNMSGAYLVLPLSGSCSVRADTDFVSVW